MVDIVIVATLLSCSALCELIVRGTGKGLIKFWQMIRCHYIFELDTLGVPNLCLPITILVVVIDIYGKTR